MKLFRIVLILLQVGVIATTCLANSIETKSQRSRIVGVVLDRNDARIVRARITIQNAEFRRRVRSDSEGRFELELPAGSYEITVEQSGFKTFKLGSVRAGAGETAEVNIHMEVERPKEPLKISAAPKVPKTDYTKTLRLYCPSCRPTSLTSQFS